MARNHVLITGYSRMPPNSIEGTIQFMKEFCVVVDDLIRIGPWADFNLEDKEPVMRTSVITETGHIIFNTLFKEHPALFHVDIHTEKEANVDAIIDKLHHFTHIDSYQITILDRSSGIKSVSISTEEDLPPQNVMGDPSLISPFLDPNYVLEYGQQEDSLEKEDSPIE